MAFPTSPSNNQVHKEGNRSFVWDSTLGTWDQVKEADRLSSESGGGVLGTIGKGILGSDITFPTGHVLKVQHVIDSLSNSTSGTTYAIACSSLAFSVVSASSTLWITGTFQWSGNDMNSKVKSVWSTNDFTSITTISESSGFALRNNDTDVFDFRVPFSEKYTHGLAAGSNIRFRIYANRAGGSNTLNLNAADSARMTIMEVM